VADGALLEALDVGERLGRGNIVDLAPHEAVRAIIGRGAEQAGDVHVGGDCPADRGVGTAGKGEIDVVNDE
jgi:hypothetical protein